MTHNDLPQDPTAGPVTQQTDLQHSITEKPRKSSNMRSRWKKSSHGQSKTPDASNPTFGIVEQPIAPPKPEKKVEKTEAKTPEVAAKAPIEQETVTKAIEEPSAPQKSLRPRTREEQTEAPRRFPKPTDNNQQKPYPTRPSFNRPPLRREQEPRTSTKSSMDYEPSRASLQKKQSLEEAILKSQETSLWAKIKQFFTGFFSSEKTETKQESRSSSSRHSQRPFQRYKRPYYSKNPSRGRKEP